MVTAPLVQTLRDFTTAKPRLSLSFLTRDSSLFIMYYYTRNRLIFAFPEKKPLSWNLAISSPHHHVRAELLPRGHLGSRGPEGLPRRPPPPPPRPPVPPARRRRGGPRLAPLVVPLPLGIQPLPPGGGHGQGGELRHQREAAAVVPSRCVGMGKKDDYVSPKIVFFKYYVCI